jgi:lysozyme
MKYIEIASNICKEFEGLKLEAYLCPAGKWTIGYGSTFYQNGTRVKKGDKITLDQANKLLENILMSFDKDLDTLLTTEITDNQRGALLDFAFNAGSDIDADTIAEGLGDSTLLKKVNANPSDKTIEQEFMKWNKFRNPKTGAIEVLAGLTRRRRKEADIYFSK